LRKGSGADLKGAKKTPGQPVVRVIAFVSPQCALASLHATYSREWEGPERGKVFPTVNDEARPLSMIS
jgi:hypothetical protein